VYEWKKIGLRTPLSVEMGTDPDTTFGYDIEFSEKNRSVPIWYGVIERKVHVCK